MTTIEEIILLEQRILDATEHLEYFGIMVVSGVKSIRDMQPYIRRLDYLKRQLKQYSSKDIIAAKVFSE